MPALRLERCKPMNESEIRKYAGLMKELGLTGLEITEKDQTVRLERSGVPLKAEALPDAAALEQKPKQEISDDTISVRSSFVGVFYAAPAENAAPYVAVGDRVKKGQPLCLVEAMKLMNEITAEEDGMIDQICAANGQVVEYGTELFRIRR